MIMEKKKKKTNQPTLDLTHCEFWNDWIKEKKRKELFFLQRCWVNEECIYFYKLSKLNFTNQNQTLLKNEI